MKRYKWSFFVVILFNCVALGLSFFMPEWSHKMWVIDVMNLIVLIYLFIWSGRIFSFILRKISNDIPGMEKHQASVQDIVDKLIEKKEEIDHIIAAIDKIGEDHFERDIQKINNKQVQTSFKKAHEKIMAFKEKERESSWVNAGVVAISNLRFMKKDEEDYTKDVMSTIVKYLDASLGSFYLLKTDEEGNECFELAASFARDQRYEGTSKIYPGEGLVGQIYYEKSIRCFSNLPDNYIKISSGLGGATPLNLCVIPVISDQTVYGAIEIASFKKHSEKEQTYLQLISESVGHYLANKQSQDKREKLLHESQSMAEELKLNESELKQHMEELTTTQEEMNKHQVEMDAVLSSLSTIELNANGIITNANSIFLSLSGYSERELVGKAYREMIPQEQEAVQYDLMWSSIIAGKPLAGEFRILHKKKKEIWMAGNFTPIINHGNIEKVMLIALFITRDKEKLFELQEVVAGFKNNFALAEVNADLSFRAPSNLFLEELGIKRIDLRKYTAKEILDAQSIHQLEAFMDDKQSDAAQMEMLVENSTGEQVRYNATLMSLKNGDQEKRGLMILQRLEKLAYGNTGN